MRPGLGRGLDSLLKVYDDEIAEEKIKKQENVTVDKIYRDTQKISMDKIYTNPNQPRKTFDKDSLNELAESIRLHGLSQPIVVNQTADGYMIIAGERRYSACKICGLKEHEFIILQFWRSEV